MQPYRRQLSYSVIQSIVPRIEYAKRMELSKWSKVIRGVHKRTPIAFNYIKFHQPLRDLNPTGSGTLHVDGVEYVFTYDELANKVSIECSLSPGRKMVGPLNIARLYFDYFIAFPIEHLELQECGNVLPPGTRLLCNSLTWDLGENGSRSWLEFLFLDEQMRRTEDPTHYFDRLEIRHNALRGRWRHSFVNNCSNTIVWYRYKSPINSIYKRIVWSRLIKANAGRSKEVVRMAVRHKAKGPDFLPQAEKFLNDDHLKGSLYQKTFSFSPDRKQAIWQEIRQKYVESREAVLFGRECLIVDTKESTVSAVFHEYDQLRDEETFMWHKCTMLTDTQARKCSVLIRNARLNPDLPFHRFDVATSISKECGVSHAENAYTVGSDLKLQFVTREDARKVIGNFSKVRRRIVGCSEATARAEVSHRFPTTAAGKTSQQERLLLGIPGVGVPVYAQSLPGVPGLLQIPQALLPIYGLPFYTAGFPPAASTAPRAVTTSSIDEWNNFLRNKDRNDKRRDHARDRDREKNHRGSRSPRRRDSSSSSGKIISPGSALTAQQMVVMIPQATVIQQPLANMQPSIPGLALPPTSTAPQLPPGIPGVGVPVYALSLPGVPGLLQQPLLPSYGLPLYTAGFPSAASTAPRHCFFSTY